MCFDSLFNYYGVSIVSTERILRLLLNISRNVRFTESVGNPPLLLTLIVGVCRKRIMTFFKLFTQSLGPRLRSKLIFLLRKENWSCLKPVPTSYSPRR